MNRRARSLAACCAVALVSGVSIVVAWRHGAVAPGAVTSLRPVHGSSMPPADELRSATPAPRTAAEVTAAAPAPAATGVAPATASSEIGSDEESLMRLLRSAQHSDAALAILLAREGNRRFPRSSAAPERASILIHALSEQGLSSEARGEAEDMVNRYPDSAWVHDVERFTGARRHRNIRVGPNGELHYVDPAPPT